MGEQRCKVLEDGFKEFAEGLDKKVSLEIVSTRGDNNPYYAVNPSGRVPSLELELLQKLLQTLH